MGHGRRMSTKMYLVAFELCCVRDGEKCANCGWTYGEKPTAIQRQYHFDNNLQRLELHHRDGNPWNNPPDGSNWELRCRTCNLWVGVDETGEGEREREKKKLRGRKVGNKAEEEVERMERGSSTRILKQQADYRAGETSQEVNAICEPRFRGWALGEVLQKGQVKRDEVVDAGAEVAGCGQAATKRYLRKLTSYAGPLKVETDTNGENWVMLREKGKPKKRRARKKKEVDK